MEYGFEPNESVEAGVKRIASEQIRLAIDEANDTSIDRHEAVHRIRKRCKKQRALIRLVRPSLAETFERDNAFFRDLSRNLSTLRDAQALLECFDRTLDHFKATIDRSRFTTLRRFLTNQRDEYAGDQATLVQRTKMCAEQLEKAFSFVEEWSIPSDDFTSFASGLEKTYRRAGKAMRQIQKHPATEQLHEWRKRVKYHGYHAKLLGYIAPDLLAPHRELAEQLGTRLGEDHDLAVLGSSLFSPGSSAAINDPCLPEFRTLIQTRQLQLQSDAIQLGGILLAEKPRHLIRRWQQYWRVERDSRAETN